MIPVASKIGSELVIFGMLVAVSELCRWAVRRRFPESAAVHALFVCSLVLGWYSFSVSLVLFNKFVIFSWDVGGMKFPIILYSMTNMFMKGVIPYTFIRCVRGVPIPEVSQKTMMGVMIVGACTGLDVALANQSFLYISVTFYTMLKAASLIFILCFGVAMRVEPCSFRTVATVSIITCGIFMASYGEAAFNMIGFQLVIFSEVFASVRWVVTQILLQTGDVDAMTALVLMAPASTLTLAPAVAAYEWDEMMALMDMKVALKFAAVAVVPGFFAFFLLLIEMELVRATSSLTLTVFGNLKTVVTILFATFVFGEKSMPLQWAGLGVACVGLFVYSVVRQEDYEDELPEDDATAALEKGGEGEARTRKRLHFRRASLDPLACVGFQGHGRKAQYEPDGLVQRGRKEGMQLKRATVF